MRSSDIRAAGLLLVLGLAIVAADVAAGEPPEEGPDAPDDDGPWSLGYANVLVARYNPLGVKDDLDLRLRRRLLESDSVLLDGTYAGGLVHTSFSPSKVHLGLGLEVMPLAVLRLKGIVEWVPFFRTFDNMLSFPSPRAEHGDDDRAALADAGEDRAARALYVKLAALLQAKVGPAALRSELTAVHVRMRLGGEDTVYYEPEWDLLVQPGSWVLLDDTDLLLLTDLGLIAGARYSLAHAFYTHGAFADGEPRRSASTPTHRLGPLLGFRFATDRADFADPTVLLMVNWWLEHRYRAGQETHQGIPYLVLAFAFEGRLWP